MNHPRGIAKRTAAHGVPERHQNATSTVPSANSAEDASKSSGLDGLLNRFESIIDLLPLHHAPLPLILWAGDQQRTAVFYWQAAPLSQGTKIEGSALSTADG